MLVLSCFPPLWFPNFTGFQTPPQKISKPSKVSKLFLQVSKLSKVSKLFCPGFQGFQTFKSFQTFATFLPLFATFLKISKVYDFHFSTKKFPNFFGMVILGESFQLKFPNFLEWQVSKPKSFQTFDIKSFQTSIVSLTNCDGCRMRMCCCAHS